MSHYFLNIYQFQAIKWNKYFKKKKYRDLNSWPVIKSGFSLIWQGAGSWDLGFVSLSFLDPDLVCRPNHPPHQATVNQQHIGVRILINVLSVGSGIPIIVGSVIKIHKTGEDTQPCPLDQAAMNQCSALIRVLVPIGLICWIRIPIIVWSAIKIHKTGEDPPTILPRPGSNESAEAH